MQEQTKKEQSKALPSTKLPVESELEKLLEKLKDLDKVDGDYPRMKERAQVLINQVEIIGYDILHKALIYHLELRGI